METEILTKLYSVQATSFLKNIDVFGLLRATREMHQGDQEDAKL